MQDKNIKLALCLSLETNTELSVENVRKIKADNNKEYYVLTNKGLYLGKINEECSKIIFEHSSFKDVIECKLLKNTKGLKLRKIKIANKKVKNYNEKTLIENPPTWLDISQEEIYKAWKRAVHVATYKGTIKTNYGAVVGILNKLK